jgi:hydrogenase maturation protein HypF
VGSFPLAERVVLGRMLERGVNAPLTTSAGRLFDAVAALVGFAGRVTFEGEAAMGLEWSADARERGAYPLPVVAAEGGTLVLDWAPMLDEILSDLERGTERGVIAARFHGALVGAVVEVAARVGERHVALSGGCFQNRRLTEQLADALEARGHEVLLHERVPPNDGGLALGQIAVAAARIGMG